MRLQKDGKVG